MINFNIKSLDWTDCSTIKYDQLPTQISDITSKKEDLNKRRPQEIIFSYLKPQDLLSFSLACKYFYLSSADFKTKVAATMVKTQKLTSGQFDDILSNDAKRCSCFGATDKAIEIASKIKVNFNFGYTLARSNILQNLVEGGQTEKARELLHRISGDHRLANFVLQLAHLEDLIPSFQEPEPKPIVCTIYLKIA